MKYECQLPGGRGRRVLEDYDEGAARAAEAYRFQCGVPETEPIEARWVDYAEHKAGPWVRFPGKPAQCVCPTWTDAMSPPCAAHEGDEARCARCDHWEACHGEEA